jgi:hypothetical protein
MGYGSWRIGYGSHNIDSRIGMGHRVWIIGYGLWDTDDRLWVMWYGL